MDKEKIFSKLNAKDYNKELEKILDTKSFSKDVKNLLLSMLYKIETGYKDYITVKRIVENKKNYIEQILAIIEQKAKQINIVGENSEKGLEIKQTNTHFLVDKLEGTINLIHPNEKLMLYTIYKLDDKQVYLDEKYNLIRIALSELLNAGENMNNIEVLRDFNGWSWNTRVEEIPEITTNLIYQNLIYLLGIELVKQWVHTQEVKDYVKVVKETLKDMYKEENSKEILKLIYKISILICSEKNIREKERLIQEKEDLEEELNILENKPELLTKISDNKKTWLKQIGEIDAILNDRELLEKEYITRNEKRPEYKKIFSLSHLNEILVKERKKILEKIEEQNKLLDPTQYIQKKEKLQEQLELLENLELKEKKTKIKDYNIKLQKVFLECLKIKIENAKEKEEIIDLICMVRYYNYLYIDEATLIKDVKQLKNAMQSLQDVLIKKAYELKVLSKISNDEEENNIIIKNIFTTKIITLENVNLDLRQNEQSLEIDIYDGEVFEKTVVMPSFNKKSLAVKLGKKIKIII